MAKDALLQKFESSLQEPVRLRIALQGFFSEATESAARQKYETYLRRRVRPVVEHLIAADDLDKLQTLAELGWLDAGLLEHGLETAICQNKTEAYVWFLARKAEQVGFPDRDFSL